MKTMKTKKKKKNGENSFCSFLVSITKTWYKTYLFCFFDFKKIKWMNLHDL